MTKLVHHFLNKLRSSNLFISSIEFITNEPLSAAVVIGLAAGVFAAGFIVGWTADFVATIITKR